MYLKDESTMSELRKVWELARARAVVQVVQIVAVVGIAKVRSSRRPLPHPVAQAPT